MNKYDMMLPSTDGKNEIHVIVWENENPKAVLQLVHGMCEYIDRYDDFAKYLVEDGFTVVGHDHLGHGKSVKSNSEYGFFTSKNGDKVVIDDMYEVTKLVKEKWANVPNFILGHSMGSFFTRRYLALYSKFVSGAVIMGTGWIPYALATVGRTVALSTCKKQGEYFVSDLLIKLSIGGYNKAFEPARTPNDWLSRNTENVDKYEADPLCGFPFTAGAYRDFFGVLQAVAKNAKLEGVRKDLPVLITSGEIDPVGGKPACKKLFAQYLANGISDTTLKLYPEDRHEILNEVDRDKVYEDIKNWLNNKI